MLKKISVLTILGICLSFNASAIPNDAEYADCIKNNSTDAGLTKCYKQEIEVTKKEIQNLENILRPIITTEDAGIEALNGYTSEYIKSYCDYYVLAHEGDGYTSAYHSAKCNMIGYLQYYRDLQDLYGVSLSDIKE